MLSTANQASLKSSKTYLDNNTWLCYYHALSGDELKNQILTIANKTTDQMISYSFKELSACYKINEVQGIADQLQYNFAQDVSELLPYTIEFLNDAKIEYTGRPYIK
jgi:hypothetical protein